MELGILVFNRSPSINVPEYRCRKSFKEFRQKYSRHSRKPILLDRKAFQHADVTRFHKMSSGNKPDSEIQINLPTPE